jgi:hypothetical protein
LTWTYIFQPTLVTGEAGELASTTVAVPSPLSVIDVTEIVVSAASTLTFQAKGLENAVDTGTAPPCVPTRVETVEGVAWLPLLSSVPAETIRINPL